MIGERADTADQRVVPVHQRAAEGPVPRERCDEIVPVPLQLPVERPPVGRERRVPGRARSASASVGRDGSERFGSGRRQRERQSRPLRPRRSALLHTVRPGVARPGAPRPAAPGGRPWPSRNADTCRHALADCGTLRFHPGRCRRARPADARTPADGGGRTRPASSARRDGRGSGGKPGSAPPRRPGREPSGEARPTPPCTSRALRPRTRPRRRRSASR